MDKTVSIIIPVFNQREYTEQCLAVLINETQGIDYEVIIVDNASTDDTAAYLQRLSNYPVRIIRNKENEGYLKACNMGAAVALGKYLVFLNNDTIVNKDWLRELLDCVQSDPQAAVAGPKFVYFNGPLQEAGGIVWRDGTTWAYGWSDVPTKPAYRFLREVDYVSGACMLVVKDVFNQVGGFDVRYSPGYYEDIDLCFAVRALGYKVLYQPRTTIVHYGAVTSATVLGSRVDALRLSHKDKFHSKWAEALAAQFPPVVSNVTQASARRKGLNILIIDPTLPMYDRASGSLRLFNIIGLLRQLGHDVTYIARNGVGQEVYVDILERVGVEVYPTDRKKMIKMGQWVGGYGVDLGEILASKPYDIAWLSFYDIAEQYLDEIRFYSPQTKVVVDTVDVHFLREQRMAEVNNDRSLLHAAVQTKAREMEVYSRADRILTVTSQDAEILGKNLSQPSVTVIPNIHDPLQATPPFETRSGLLFVGNFWHTPNVDAMNYFVNDIWPIVKRSLPDVTLRIVGNKAEEYCSYNDANILVYGYQPDLSDLLCQSKVSIAPLRYGAGMKGKIGEAMMYGLPVVTTTVGAEGMNLVHEEHVLIADTSEELASQIIRVYRDQKLWTDLAVSAKQHVGELYGSRTVMKELEKLVREICSH